MSMRNFSIQVLIGIAVGLLIWWASTHDWGSVGGGSENQGREIDWDDLIPADAIDKIVLPDTLEGELRTRLLGDEAMATGREVVAELDKEQIRLPGYVVPITSDGPGTVKQFLLVPYMGACMHLPPPPPNQIVYVILNEPYELRSLWEPFWVDGKMLVQSQSLDIAEAAYTIDEADLIPYFQDEGA